MENYLFNVDADTDKAVQKLSQIQKMMDNIEKINVRAVDDNHTTDQKSMDKNLRSMREATQLYKQLSKDLDELQQKMRGVADTSVVPKGATDEQAESIRKMKTDAERQSRAAIAQQRNLQREYKETLRTFSGLAKYQQNYSKNFKHVLSSNDVRNLPSGGGSREERADNNKRARNAVSSMANEKDDITERLGGVQSKIQNVNKLDRRTESASRRAAASNYMSFQQSRNFETDVNTVRGSYKQDADDNQNEITKLGQRRGQLTKNIKEIEENPEASDAQMDKMVAMRREIEAMDTEWDARMELNRALEKSIQQVEKYNKAVQGVEVKPERGTFKGMVYERAPAIGLALGGATGLAVGGLYHNGESTKKSINEDVISIGQRTDSEDWRNSVRDPAIESGLQDRLGFSGQQMLDFQNNYLSNAGHKGMDDLGAAAQSQAEFSRVTGVGAQDTQQFYDSMYSTGAVDGLQSKDIQDAFVGAIKHSGMEGREKDQISALQGLLESVKQGKTLDNADVMNVMGLQSILSSSGERSLQGEQGGQLLAGLDQGIKAGFDNPMVRMVFGQGTKYQGLEGRFALRKQLDKGITDPENISTITEYAEKNSGGSTDIANEVFASFATSVLGAEMTGEQAEAMMNLDREGKLTEENIQKVLATDKEKGGEVAEERYNEYADSNEATENQSTAVWEKQAVQLNDFGDVIKEANSRMGNWNTVAYAATVAVAALGVAALSTAGMFGTAALIRPLVAGTHGAGGGLLGRLGRGGRGGGSGGGSGGGWFGGGRNNNGGGGGNGRGGGPSDSRYNNYRQNGAFGQGGTPPGGGANAGFFSKMKDMFRGGAGANGGGSSILGKAGGILGKAALPISALLGIGAIASAPEGEKAETTGKVAGGIGGGLAAGAATGAMVGTVAGPVGTAIGSIVGGIIGSIGGSKIGGWIGSQFGGDKGGDKASKAEEDGFLLASKDTEIDRDPNADFSKADPIRGGLSDGKSLDETLEYNANAKSTESGTAGFLLANSTTEINRDPNADFSEADPIRGGMSDGKSLDETLEYNANAKSTEKTPSGTAGFLLANSNTEINRDPNADFSEADPIRGGMSDGKSLDDILLTDKESETISDYAKSLANGNADAEAEITAAVTEGIKKKKKEATSLRATGTAGFSQANNWELMQDQLGSGLTGDMDAIRGGMSRTGTLGVMSTESSSGILGMEGTTASPTASALGLSQGFTRGKDKDIDKQLDKENTNRRDQAETKKADNLSYESENLNRYEALLDKAQQLLHQARSQNGIFGSTSGTGTFEEAGDGSQISTTMNGSEQAEKVWSFFEGNGFNNKGIAGIMGNLQQESGLDPNAVNPTNGAFGIAQWMGDRKANLHNFAEEKGTSANDLGTQLEFLMKELNGGEARTKEILDENGGINALRGATDVKAATDLFEKAFERSGGDAMGKRRDYADGYYQSYGEEGSAQWSSTGSDASTSRASSGVLKIDSKFDITLRGDETVADKVNDDKNVKSAASKIHNMIYGNSMDYFSKEMRMV